MITAMNITESAAARVHNLIKQKSDPNLKLRVYIQGGGCSGFQYGFQFDKEQNEDDMVIDQKGVTMLIDSASFQYLMGAEVEFKDDLLGSRFTINNPNATTTCGCGASFGI